MLVSIIYIHECTAACIQYVQRLYFWPKIRTSIASSKLGEIRGSNHDGKVLSSALFVRPSHTFQYFQPHFPFLRISELPQMVASSTSLTPAHVPCILYILFIAAYSIDITANAQYHILYTLHRYRRCSSSLIKRSSRIVSVLQRPCFPDKSLL
jgi:hypothetical protein